MSKIKAYLDLLRAHFIPAWILIFTAGFLVGTHQYGGFTKPLLFIIIGIAVFGFEAGMVLNDYVDRDLDKKDIDPGLTGYFRPFKKRPLVNGTIKPASARLVFFILAFIAVVLIFQLPAPNRYYVLGLMIYAYLVEYFYQIKKRNQTFPWSQLIGRTDFSLFLVAGYLAVAQPNLTALLYFCYFYPLAELHLAINDLADLKNDEQRKLFTIPRLYRIKGTIKWIWGFMILHLITASLFISQTNPKAALGFGISFLIITIATLLINKDKSPVIALKVLPLIHLSMAIQAITLIIVSR